MNTNKYPEVWYNKDGDYLEVLFDVEKDTFAKWITPHLTLIIDRETKKTNGFIIENFRYLMERIEKRDNNG